MSEPLSQYFAQEAGEFLDQMDALVAGTERPDPVRFFRLARGVRGSAQLAGAHAVAEVAERLEDGARALRDGVLEWSPEVRERVRATAGDLRALVEGHGRWSEEDAARARSAAERWSGVGSGRRRDDHPVSGDQLFAFVRREISGVVSELDRVLGELTAQPAVREPLRMVLRRMRPVRGVAGMEPLAPVLEVLEAMEDVAHEVLGRTGDASRVEMELLRAGREALGAAGAALEAGRAPGSSPELAAFRELRDTAAERAGGESGVVPLSRLFADDGGPHLVSSPLGPPVGPDGPTPEVAAFVAMEATGFLDHAEGLLSGTASQPRRFGRAGREAGELAVAVRELAKTYGFTSLAGAAETAAGRVRAAASAEEARDALQRLRTMLPGGTGAAPAAPAPGPEEPAAAAAAETGEAAEDDAVPVEQLLYAPEDALREALALRGRIESLAEGAGPGAPLGEALDELFGLVELGLSGRG